MGDIGREWTGIEIWVIRLLIQFRMIRCDPKCLPIPLVLLLAIMMVFSFGCDGQRGKFLTVGVTSKGFSSFRGCIDIISGCVNQKNTMQENLLYLVILRPGMQERNTDGGQVFGKYITTIDHRWDTDGGTYTVSVGWNRQNDTVDIGKQKFERAKGSLFVVCLESNMTSVAQQLPNPGFNVGFQQVLDYVRHQLPDNKSLESLKLQNQ
jgi:hypothetical protein